MEMGEPEFVESKLGDHRLTENEKSNFDHLLFKAGRKTLKLPHLDQLKNIFSKEYIATYHNARVELVDGWEQAHMFAINIRGDIIQKWLMPLEIKQLEFTKYVKEETGINIEKTIVANHQELRR